MVEIELKTDICSLIVKIVDVTYVGGLPYDWCHLYLNLNESQFFLGAEEKSILVKKILNGITMSNNIVNNQRKRSINENDYFYFLGLAEGEHLIGSVRKLSYGIEVLLRNGVSGNEIATFQVSETECESWQQKLRSIFQETLLSQRHVY